MVKNEQVKLQNSLVLSRHLTAMILLPLYKIHVHYFLHHNGHYLSDQPVPSLFHYTITNPK